MTWKQSDIPVAFGCRPQKGRLVADLVRGMPVGRALDRPGLLRKEGAKIIRKVLESAIANAEHNDGADIDALKVKTIHVEEGPAQAVPRVRRVAANPHPEAHLPRSPDRWRTKA